LETYRLIPHPDHPASSVKGVAMRRVDLRDGRTMLRYRVDGCGDVVLPPFAGKGRADDLWQTTCFELFLGSGNGPYLEFNFSPSARWAAYFFSSYREGRIDPEPFAQPDIHVQQGQEILVLTAYLSSEDVSGASRAGVAAVIEEKGGRKSYWALAHPEGKPDFHDPACFTATLAAPRNP
jgi:hypothetical protein